MEYGMNTLWFFSPSFSRLQIHHLLHISFPVSLFACHLVSPGPLICLERNMTKLKGSRSCCKRDKMHEQKQSNQSFNDEWFLPLSPLKISIAWCLTVIVHWTGIRFFPMVFSVNCSHPLSVLEWETCLFPSWDDKRKLKMPSARCSFAAHRKGVWKREDVEFFLFSRGVLGVLNFFLIWTLFS